MLAKSYQFVRQKWSDLVVFGGSCAILFLAWGFFALLAVASVASLLWLLKPKLIAAIEKRVDEQSRLAAPSELFENIVRSFHKSTCDRLIEIYIEVAKEYPPTMAQERQVLGILDRGFMRHEDSRQLVEWNTFGHLYFDRLIKEELFEEGS